MGRQIRQQAIRLLIIARPGTCPGWGFAGSFKLCNADSKYLVSASRRRRETHRRAIEGESAASRSDGLRTIQCRYDNTRQSGKYARAGADCCLMPLASFAAHYKPMIGKRRHRSTECAFPRPNRGRVTPTNPVLTSDLALMHGESYELVRRPRAAERAPSFIVVQFRASVFHVAASAVYRLDGCEPFSAGTRFLPLSRPAGADFDSRSLHRICSLMGATD